APELIELQFHAGFCWRPIPGATVVDNPDSAQRVDLVFTEPVVATRVRYRSMDGENNLLNELSVFGEPTDLDPIADTGQCTAGEHVAVLGPFYDYALHLPPAYNDSIDARWPLIISLHGIGGTILTEDRTAVRSNAEGFPKQIENGTLGDFAAIVVSPHCRSVGQTGDCWFDPDRLVPMLDGLEDALLEDPNRVFFTGLSGGAIVTYRLGVLLHQRLAGLIPIAGLFPGSVLSEICNLKRLHIWAFAGTADPSFPPSRNDFVRDQLLECPPLGEDYMESTAIEGGTHSGSTWDVAYSTPELHTWFLDKTKLDPIVEEVPLFEDGFETGDLLRWSESEP
ncbi:MAG: hypothetical protein MI919_40880, partial [Holophagales bacterium]|nr:hypothetical protein [Holophagales bacterium]